MFATTQDLLYIVLALCIVWFTVFLCWALYQAGRALKNANRIIENLMHTVGLMADAVQFIRDRVDHLSGKMGMISGAVSHLVERFVVGKLTDQFEKRMEKTGEKKSKDIKKQKNKH